MTLSSSFASGYSVQSIDNEDEDEQAYQAYQWRIVNGVVFTASIGFLCDSYKEAEQTLTTLGLPLRHCELLHTV